MVFINKEKLETEIKTIEERFDRTERELLVNILLKRMRDEETKLKQQEISQNLVNENPFIRKMKKFVGGDNE